MQNRRLSRFARPMFRRPALRHWLVVTVAALTLFAGLPRAASADTFLNGDCVQSHTGGSYVCTDLYQRSSDGAVYLKVWVYDDKADGLCAHGTVGWTHENGNIYNDYGMWVCGYGTGEYFTTPARNSQDYDAVWLAAFEDGNRGYNTSDIIQWWRY
jgi:hypothetical protein